MNYEISKIGLSITAGGLLGLLIDPWLPILLGVAYIGYVNLTKKDQVPFETRIKFV